MAQMSTNDERTHPRARHLPTFDRESEYVRVDAIPGIAIQDGRLVIVEDDSSSAYPTHRAVATRPAHAQYPTASVREYTPLKTVGDGSFGTVAVCDWHGPLPPNTPVPAMQRNVGTRPEYAGRRLVAVKRMKQRWSSWNECESLRELQVRCLFTTFDYVLTSWHAQALRNLPSHPSLIPLYDFFWRSDTKELFLVFEPMEGNLYQLIRSRRNRPLTGGLVASIFQQVISGIDHMHTVGYFHRDLKPENLLVTSRGLLDYPTLNPFAPPGSPPEKDVVVVVKIADFGVARKTTSAPPYTEYVAMRWYRAPEVLLRARTYSSAVDLWAFGAIMAEVVELRPLFPGTDEMDQVLRICQTLGNPSDAYGEDHRGLPLGGGRWDDGVRLAASLGLTFPLNVPLNLSQHFNHAVPIRLVECIIDLLRYDPAMRLTARQCMEHEYLRDAAQMGAPVPLP
jgi:serine/threonine protein kinase